MTVCIIGWYGTETIGDRGILAGIISILHKSFGSNVSIRLGSLYPYFSERTLKEDASFYKKVTGSAPDIRLFDSRVSRELDAAIEQCDLLMVGGGPLMHINAMYMLEYAFRRAKKKGKKTMLFGCGVGPLHKIRHQKAAAAIAGYSDRIVLRDSASLRHLRQLYKTFGKKWHDSKVAASLDPSVQCLLDFQSCNAGQPRRGAPSADYLAVNFRSFPDEYAPGKSKPVNESLFKFLGLLAEKFSGKLIRLIPMHYFHIGGDDRDFLNTLSIRLGKDNVHVQNSNLTLEQTLEVFQNAALNVGMRFHAVVFQTVLSGRNIILDYTEPQKGKISGFLNDIGASDFYKNRYHNLQTASHEDAVNMLDNIDLNGQFHFDTEAAKKKLEAYPAALSQP
ncbi:MAG TPA: polysaccharide pyruvyl transferase family protein [Chitinophagales bacterium]|nr:polysaccharide pyruvyl transferase family protein [Chitinophagales bacterium]